MDSFYNKFNLAFKLHKKNNINQALISYLELYSTNRDSFDLLYLIGTAYTQISQPKLAIPYLEKALKINDKHIGTNNNLGGALFELKRFQESLKIYEKLINIDPNNNLAKNNLANCYLELKYIDKAINIFEKLLEENPNDFIALNNFGNVYKKLNNYNLAISKYKKSLEINSNYILAYKNMGDVLCIMGDYSNGLNMYKKVNDINPEYKDILSKIHFAKMRICDWENYETLKTKIIKEINNGKKIDPFITLSLTDNPQIQKKTSENFIKENFENINQHKKIIFKKTNVKPKIGYFSADFKSHPVMHLISDIFKYHDKSKFDFFAFSLEKHSEDDWNKNLNKYFKKFIYVNEISDEKTALLAKDIGLDIAIDLNGFTEGSRPGIFYNRCAPIQINFLGYPGTMGAKFIDYIIADKILIKKTEEQNFTEKILFNDGCYQPNIKERKISEKLFKREDFNLPKDSFVFCSFNTNYKITPKIFNAWINILKKVKNSVLWILCNNQEAIRNLRKVIIENKIDEKRLIFAQSLPIEEHLKRINLADLFLDTFPYTAHTTASDAVRMGLPIITLKGESFASRVAASILNELNLNELITSNLEDYTSLAIEIASSKDKHKRIKEKLLKSLKNSKLFDGNYFTKRLENIYTKLLNI